MRRRTASESDGQQGLPLGSVPVAHVPDARRPAARRQPPPRPTPELPLTAEPTEPQHAAKTGPRGSIERPPARVTEPVTVPRTPLDDPPAKRSATVPRTPLDEPPAKRSATKPAPVPRTPFDDPPAKRSATKPAPVPRTPFDPAHSKPATVLLDPLESAKRPRPKPAAARTPAKPAKPTRSTRPALLDEPPAKQPSRRASVPAPAPLDAAWDRLVGLPGLGPKTAARLVAQGFAGCHDLARWIPASYRDQRRRDRVDLAADGAEVIVVATVRRFRQSFFRGRYVAAMELVQDTVDGPRPFVARWFHRVGGLGERGAVGNTVLLIGKAQRKGGTIALVHPELRDADAALPDLDIRYPEIDGLGDASIARLCRAALARLAQHLPDDPLPAELRARLGLPALLPALALLHDPPPDLSEATWREIQEGRSPAHRRLLFDDLLHVQLRLLRQRATYRAAGTPVGLIGEGDRRERLRVCVPFEPTAAQWRAIDEVEADLAAGRPMLRLIQGDVGSGKTLVAFAACLGVIDAGGQVAVMAPTEILARQHLQTLAPWCAAAGVKLGLITGSSPRSERNALLAAVRAGEVDLLIGTHALLTTDVGFRRLGLVVIDEQHRFGVRQRATLRDKGGSPHLLVMTATPIPRTLALTLYGELDVSILDELPPGRTPTTTRLFAGPRAREPARAALAALARRVPAFVVCPQVEPGERPDISDVEATAADLRARLPDRKIGVLHGRMSAAEKDAVIAAFRAGQLAVVVATTVIEVGVDIPAAQAILVEHADCFGLAQLHQLRGRIGRSAARGIAEPPVCLLHTAGGADAAARLQILVDSHDGFKVAERDLAERGPGELFGLRQAGASPLRLAGLAGEGLRLLASAREVAQELLARDPELTALPALRAELTRRDATVVGGDAG